ncbi:MAG: DnaJ domain-containing protein [Chromatiales bacterium]|jgi:curved DNA-binding protein|nr:DnaJ domain-containing protein [Chromatiales bacterium]
MQFQDYYKTLGVERDASAEVIKSAYRRAARRFHPDVSKETNAEERFKAVGEAYEVLRDAQKRAAYDQLGPNWKAGQEFRAPPGWGGRPGGPRGAGAGGDAFSDFFGELFGNRAGAGRSSPGGRPRQPEPARPASQAIEVSLEEVYAGAERQLRVSETGPHQGGGTRTLKVRIPQGVTDGQSIRLTGQGAAGADGRRGDLFLDIRIAAHPRFSAQGQNVHLELPLAPWEAALGATVEVPTLGGKVDLRVPAGTKAGAKLRLKGRGLGKDAKGDQMCTVVIALPAAETDEDKAAYRALADAFDFDPREGF